MIAKNLVRFISAILCALRNEILTFYLLSFDIAFLSWFLHQNSSCVFIISFNEDLNDKSGYIEEN